MKDSDFVTMATAWEVADDLFPPGYDLRFKTDRQDASHCANSAIELRGGGLTRSYDCANVGELKRFIKEFIAESVAQNGPVPFITGTGLDEQTDIDDMVRWNLLDFEMAFLYSERHAGEAKRYPPWEFIVEQAKKIPRAALHICGKPAQRKLLAGELDVSSFQRIQVNGAVKVPDVKELCKLYPDKTIILQYQGPGDDFFLTYEHDNLALLVDASGGNGILPDGWPLLETDHPVGFAGGLNPDNMEEQVRMIRSVAREGWWVDLESGLRDEEWFSSELMRYCHRSFQRGLEFEIKTPETHPEHDVVGKFWAGWDGIVYLCDSYDPKRGYWMTPVDVSGRRDEGEPKRRNISESAIARTYYQRWKCPHCGIWLKYTHETEDACHHKR